MTDPSAPERPHPPRRASTSPVLVWIRTTSRLTFALAVLAVVVVTVALLLILNPGHRVGPVQPAVPAVGQGDLPGR